jgi:carboxy-cis,cis-muconate cyclase
VTSLFAERHPDKVEHLVLLHPVRNLPPTARDNMRKRAVAASTTAGLSGIAALVAATAVSKTCAATDYSAMAFIRHLVATTQPAAYAAACGALAGCPAIDGGNMSASVPVHIIGGDEDYLAGPEAVGAWAGEIARGSHVVLDNVGHWGAIEVPVRVGAEIARVLAPTTYNLLMGTFRSPYIYSVKFDTISGKLDLQTTNTAVGGHSWLDVSPDGRTLYTTNWAEPSSISSYAIEPATADKPFPTTKLLQVAPSKYLSGYVCSNDKAVYSACGPQVDVFLIDPATGALKDEPAVQSFALVSQEDMHKGTAQLDFGGLRHGGHSADLSPDGSKLYVADIGRNCIWMYHVDPCTGYLALASKNVATRPDDGPRHAWPHPGGKLVYSLQEHTSYVDVFQLSADDQRLEFVEGAAILPAGDSKKRYWADEVRLSPDARVLFGSTRGLEKGTRGWVTAWNLTPEGRLVDAKGADAGAATHRFETPTSGGWANAIAVCPNYGPRGEVFLTLTDSEDGTLQVLGYLPDEGFKVVDEVKVGTGGDEHGASVAVWL